MIKIDTTLVIRNLKGEAFKDEDNKDLTLGKTLAMTLTSSQQGGKMKCFLLSKRFYDLDSVEVDIADYAIIKQSLETSTQSNNLVLGQAIVMIEEAKEAKGAEPKVEDK